MLIISIDNRLHCVLNYINTELLFMNRYPRTMFHSLNKCHTACTASTCSQPSLSPIIWESSHFRHSELCQERIKSGGPQKFTISDFYCMYISLTSTCCHYKQVFVYQSKYIHIYTHENRISLKISKLNT